MPSRTPGISTFGGKALLGLLSLASGGSLILGGAAYFDRSQVGQAELFYGTGAFLSYDDVVCTNTGGLAKYSSCSWQNPSSTQSGVLMHVQVDTEEAPAGRSITCSTSVDGTATGTVLFKYVATASGHAIGTSNPLAQTGTGGRLAIVPPSHYVRCWQSGTPRPGYTKNLPLKQQLRVWFNEYYQP